MASVKLKDGARYAPQEAQEASGLPAEWANAPFVFVHYPTGWEWDDDARDFLPTLSRIFQVPGCNGVGDDLKLNRALGGSMAKGGTVIDPRNARLGEWANYVIKYPTINGHYHYAFVGTEFEVLPNGRAAIINNGAGYLDFRRYLVTQRLVDPIPDMVANQIVDREGNALDRLIRAARDNPHRNDEVEQARARLARIVARRDGVDAKATVKAKPARLPKGETAPALDLSADPA